MSQTNHKETKDAPKDRKLLTVQKASELYGLEPTLIYYWIRYKEFDFLKIGEKVLFRESDFLVFLEQHVVKKVESEEIRHETKKKALADLRGKVLRRKSGENLLSMGEPKRGESK